MSISVNFHGETAEEVMDKIRAFAGAGATQRTGDASFAAEVQEEIEQEREPESQKSTAKKSGGKESSGKKSSGSSAQSGTSKSKSSAKKKEPEPEPEPEPSSADDKADSGDEPRKITFEDLTQAATALIEAMDGDMRGAQDMVQEKFGVRKISQLDEDNWGECYRWMVDEAQKRNEQAD